MKAILINPIDRTVTEVDVRAGNLQDIYDAIKATYFDVAHISDGDCIYVDDEGLLKLDTTEGRCGFIFDYHHPLAGRGLILGTNLHTGEATEPVVTVDIVKKNIKFIDL